MTEPLHVIKITVRIEVPVVFSLPADADERGVTWDDLNQAAIDRVNGALTGDFAQAIEEIVAMRGPGSGGHFTSPRAEEIMAAPHLFLDFPDKVEDAVDRVERLQREADLDAFGASTADVTA